MAQIHGLAFGLGLVGVQEYHFRKQARLHETEGNGGADKTAANHSNFSGI